MSTSVIARPLVHGHRGCRGLLPENTLPAFLHAVALGVDVLELDVVISADEQVVVSHEPWLSALLCLDAQGQAISPAEERRYNLYQLPYEEIQRCECGLRHPGFPQQEPQPSFKPLLRDVLRAADELARELGRPPVGYSVEIKSRLDGDNIFHPEPARFVELVLAQLRGSGALERSTVLSFDDRILQAARIAEPSLRLCLLTEDQGSWSKLFRRLGFVPEVFGPDFRLLSASSVQSLRRHYPGLHIVPWTVNELADMRTVLTWEVDGITTDYPDRLLQLLQSPAPSA